MFSTPEYAVRNCYSIEISGGSVYPFYLYANQRERFTQSKSEDGDNTPRNASGEVVVSVPISAGEASRKVYFADLEDYGTNDIWSDNNAMVYLWLPNGAPKPTPTLLGASAGARRLLGDGDDGVRYEFSANGYRHKALLSSSGEAVVESEKLVLESFDINSFEVVRDEVDGDAVDVLEINVTAYPETWLAGFLDSVIIRASTNLVSWEELDLTADGVETDIELDGTATYRIPLPPTTSHRFFKFEEKE